MLAFVAAALVQLPAPTVRTTQGVLQEVMSEIREDRTGARIRAFVEASGRVRTCVVIAYSGQRKSADKLCEALVGEAVSPARDADGTALAGYFETTIWLTPGREETSPLAGQAPDLEMTVSRMPADTASPYRLVLGLIVDASGAIARCGPIKVEPEALVEAACAALAGTEFPVVADRRGTPVRYARPFHAEFQTDAAAPDGA